MFSKKVEIIIIISLLKPLLEESIHDYTHPLFPSST